MAKLLVAVPFGFRSAEHDISIITAINAIIRPLETSSKYEVLPIYITKEGRWYADTRLAKLELYTSGDIEKLLPKLSPAQLTFDDGLHIKESKRLGKSRKIDIVFPANHGTYGEDGSLQGLLRMAGVPYVGCGLSASVLAMDKVLAKLLAEAHKIPITKFQYFTRDDFTQHKGAWLTQIKKLLKYPLFVKPAHLGSSIAITKVKNEKELSNAIEVALHYDDKALVEEAVPHLVELTLPITGTADRPRPALLEKPLQDPEKFFDFDTKYLHGGKKGKGGGEKGAQGYSEVPADISKELYKKAEDIALAAYKTLGCEGMARVDLLVNSKTSDVYFNEVNPLPGSLYAHNWKKAGHSNLDLVETLIDQAFERHEREKQATTTFDTNFLKQF